MNQPDQEQFTDLERRLRFERTKAALLLGALMMPGGAPLDLITYPKQFWQLTALRGAASVILVLGYFVVVRLPATASIGRISMGLLLVPALAMAWMIYLTDGAASLYYLGLILLMVFIQLLGFTLAEAATFCGCCVLTYALAVFQNETPIEAKGKLALFGLFFLGTTGLVSVVICAVNRRSRENDFRLRRELANTNQQLVTINRQRGEFLANVSHELRTPLAMVLAPLDEVLSLRGSVSEHVGQSLAIVRRNADRLRFLVDDLLDVVRIETAQFRLQREDADGRDLILEVVHSMQGVAKTRGVQLVCQATPDRVDLNIDIGRVERIMFNLITNAIKFSPSGSTVRVRLNVDQNDAVFRCLDSGPGIPAEFRERVFERHFQIPSAAQRLSPGLGLGLAIAKEITQAHGGSIECCNVNEASGSGCEFIVRLPLAKTLGPGRKKIEPTALAAGHIGLKIRDGLPAASAVGSQLQTLSAAQQTPNNQSLTLATDSNSDDTYDVLVIDDEHDIRQFLQNSLRQRYRTSVAESAASGIEAARLVRPRCILLDMMLPDHDGLWVLQQIRQTEELIDSKVLMLTAHSDESVKLRALESGVDDFLPKPFGIAELHARVAGLIRSSRLQQALREEKRELERAMTQLKSTEAQLFQSEKMRAVGTLAAGLLHEINNPVNYTLMAVKILQRDLANGKPIGETIDDVRQGVTRIGDIIGDLRSFAYPDQAQVTTEFRLRDAIDSALRFAANDLKDIPVTIALPTGKEIWVSASRSQITQVLLNLLVNAAKATIMSASERTPHIELRVHPQAGRAIVEVQDNGAGMSEDTLARITEPFFTTAQPGDGLGLGLSISDTIARAHGSCLKFTSKPQVGTTVMFDLLLSSAAESR